MGKIIWLASYPRSGNTWLRVFVGNYLSDRDRPININKIEIRAAYYRAIFDEIVGVEASDLTFDEIERYRGSSTEVFDLAGKTVMPGLDRGMYCVDQLFGYPFGNIPNIIICNQIFIPGT